MGDAATGLSRAASGIMVDAYGRAHATAMLLAAGVSLAVHHAWPAAIVGATSLAAWIAIHRGRWTPRGTLGMANTLTLLRAMMIVVLPALAAAPPGPAVALLVLTVGVLDAADGWLARKRHESSEFGARFDMESDALLVLMCSLVLFQSGRLGSFVLVPGLLRYAYVAWLAAMPEHIAEAPRSLLGRSAFGIVLAAFVASAWPMPGHAPVALAACALIALSFGRSIHWSLRSLRRT